MSVILALWITAIVICFVLIQWMGYIFYWRPEVLAGKQKIPPRQLLITVTAVVWSISFLFLGLSRADMPLCNVAGLLIVPAIGCFPFYALGKKLAAFVFKHRDDLHLKQLEWKYCHVGMIIGWAAASLPVAAYFMCGVETILYDIPVAVAFVGGTALSCIMGIMTGLESMQKCRE